MTNSIFHLLLHYLGILGALNRATGNEPEKGLNNQLVIHKALLLIYALQYK